MPVSYARLIREIPDFPQPGRLFWDITPLLQNGPALREAVQDLCQPYRSQAIDHVVAVEARGFIFGVPMALEFGVGFVPVRKVGKLPLQTIRAEYTLAYGQGAIEIHRDSLLPGERVLIVDDLLATGGTLEATISMVEQMGATVMGVAVLIEIESLKGRERLKRYPIFSSINV